MESVREILSARGYSGVNELDVNERVEVDPGGGALMPLTVVERLG